jgi:hypothetical protein
MPIGKRIALLAAAIVTVPMLAASADAITLKQKPSGYSVARVDVQYYRGHRRYARRNAGPLYGRGYMNCINSGHPADFCQTVSRDFRGSR